jgi:tripartite-type tricarboxylate transporter receptor subunit TctC
MPFMVMHLKRTIAALAVLLAAWPGAAMSQPSAEEFYRGKKIDLIIGYSPGGTYDLYARLVARHLGNHIPGKPLIVPRNMPGAGSRAAANWVYNVAPRDGTVLATADQSLSLQQAAGDKRISFDTTKFIYIGNPNIENNTTAAWHTSGVRTLDDAKRREVTVGATGGSTSSQYPKAMNALLGTKFKIVVGYPGGNDVNLAMERGEVEVRGSNSWSSWKATRADWLAEKKINILVQIGLAKTPDLPDVPLLMELGANDDDRRLLRVLSASTALGRPIFTTPDVPAERVEALRQAFAAMVRDPAFVEEAKRGKFDIDPSSGEAMQKIVTEMMAVPKAQSERLRQIIE